MKTAKLPTYPGHLAPATLAAILSPHLAPLGVLPLIHVAPHGASGALTASYSFGAGQLDPRGSVRIGALAAAAVDMSAIFAGTAMPAGADVELLSLNIEFNKAPASGELYVAPSSKPLNWQREWRQMVTMQGRDSKGDLCFTGMLSVDVTPADGQAAGYEPL